MPKKSYIKISSIWDLRRYRLETIRGWIKEKIISPQDRRRISRILPRARTFEAAWWDIRSKFGKDIRKADFQEYFYKVRKARKKLKMLDKEQRILYPPKFMRGTSIFMKLDYDKAVRYFKQRLKAVRNVLKRNFLGTHNEAERRKLYHNIIDVFGAEGDALILAELFKSMSIYDIVGFFKKYPDWNKLLFGSPQSIFELLKITVWKPSDILSKLREYIKENRIEV